MAHTEHTFTATLVNVGDLRRNSGECHEGAFEYGIVGSPNFAKVRQSSHEGARILLVHPGTCLTMKNPLRISLSEAGLSLRGSRSCCPYLLAPYQPRSSKPRFLNPVF